MFVSSDPVHCSGDTWACCEADCCGEFCELSAKRESCREFHPNLSRPDDQNPRVASAKNVAGKGEEPCFESSPGPTGHRFARDRMRKRRYEENVGASRERHEYERGESAGRSSVEGRSDG
jgi:hypothetical protein